jgi:sulfur carrier protein ThiS adenylyltransferase
MRIKLNETYREVLPPCTVEELRQRFKPEADVCIVNGFPAVKEDPLCPDDKVVFIRRGEVPTRNEFESLVTARHTPGVHEKVKKSVVGIAGLGGLGSAVAVALARLGVGEMILVDFDVVEPSNLNRQQYFADQIGMTKVAALTENLRRINPYIHLRSHEVQLTVENMAPLFSGAAVVVEAFDGAEDKALLYNTVLRRLPDTFVVGVSGLAGYGPSEEIGIRRFAGRGFVVGDGTAAAGPGVGLMAPRVGVAANHQANLVLRVLLKEEG